MFVFYIISASSDLRRERRRRTRRDGKSLAFDHLKAKNKTHLGTKYAIGQAKVDYFLHKKAKGTCARATMFAKVNKAELIIDATIIIVIVILPILRLYFNPSTSIMVIFFRSSS